MSSWRYYDAIAPKYRSVFERRRKFLEGVDRVVLAHSPAIVNEYLDVGCGDGIRSAELARRCGARHVTLVDSSPKMAQVCEENCKERLRSAPFEVRQGQVSDCGFEERSVDLVTCLWNVPGHLASRESRVALLVELRRLLAGEGSRVVVDVNNRYNLEAYGFRSVLCNLLKRCLCLRSAGLFTLVEGDVEEVVYIHSPFEFEKVAEEAGLRVVEKFYVDYKTGRFRRFFWQGQVVYVLGR